MVALPELRELALATWGVDLDANAQVTVRAWASVPTGAGSLSQADPACSGQPANDPLSPRETEVLELMARGMSNRLIAREIDLSPHTVKCHVAHILNKLNVALRSQAAAWFRAHRTG